MLLARTVTAFVVLTLLFVVEGVARSVPPKQRWQALLTGVFAGYALCMLAAIQYPPVGVVVATFYLFPILIACIEWRSGRQSFSIAIVITLSAHIRKGGDSRPILLHTLGFAFIVFAAAAMLNGGAVLPHTEYA